MKKIKYNQNEIKNINLLLKTGFSVLKKLPFKISRCSAKQLVHNLEQALTVFNQMPPCSFTTFNDTKIIQQYHNSIAHGAIILHYSKLAKSKKSRMFWKESLERHMASLKNRKQSQHYNLSYNTRYII